VWGSICDDGWDQTDAHIVCTQLGQPDLAPVAFYGSHFGDGTFPIVYSNMACVGSETTLASCSKSSYLQFSCPRTKVAGVLCGYGQ
jgi:deleted-in-malignant-brain-tumors protein 1